MICYDMLYSDEAYLSHLEEGGAAVGHLPHLPVAESGPVLFLYVESPVRYNGPPNGSLGLGLVGG